MIQQRVVLLFCVTVWLVGTMEGEASVFTVGGRGGEEREEEGMEGEVEEREEEGERGELRAEGK